MQCKTPGCTKPTRTRGYCKPHYDKLYKAKAIAIRPKPPNVETCTLLGCDRKHKAKGLCNFHYEKQRYEINKYESPKTALRKAAINKYGSACNICEKPLSFREANVDHDHTCCPVRQYCEKCIRGILCKKCNHGIGNFQDDVTLLRKAIEYLDSQTDKV